MIANSKEFLEACFLASPPPGMEYRHWLEQALRRAYQLLGQAEVDEIFREELTKYLEANPIRTARIYRIY